MTISEPGSGVMLPQFEQPSAEQISSALGYIDAIEGYVNENMSDMPLLTKAKLRGYFRQPNVAMRDELAVILLSEILETTQNSYDPSLVEYSDLHERALFFALAKARMIDHIRYATLGNRKQSRAESGLMMKALGNLAWSLPAADEATVYRIRDNARAMVAVNETLPLWYQAKINTFLNPLDSKRVHSILFGGHEQTGEADKLAESNDELAAEIAYLQKYMPKQCIAPALPGESTKEWLIIPGLSAWRDDPLHPANHLKFMMMGADGAIESSETSVYRFGVGSQQQEIVEFEGLEGKEITAAVALGTDGELYSTLGQRMLDYIPEQEWEAYEKLRSEVLCIYHDSVVPVYITELVDQELAMHEDGKQTGNNSEEDSIAKLRRLVLARKVVSEHLKDEIIDELENPNKDVVNHRETAKHEVIGHIRRLPKNFKASPAARNKCLEMMGIELAEYGETFVIPHERGTLDKPSKGHKAVFTAGRIASRQAI